MTERNYSHVPLISKLNLKPGKKMYVQNAPANYFQLLGTLPEGVKVVESLEPEMDFIHIFVTRSNQLADLLPMLKRALKKDGMLWISYPKRTSRVDTNLSETRVIETGLMNGLVDIKVAAIDSTWSGLKFVYRLKDRV